MSYLEQYKVTHHPIKQTNQVTLTVDPKYGTPPYTPVDSILLVRGIPSGGVNRAGIEAGDGTATVYLNDPDFTEAKNDIKRNSHVNYTSAALGGTIVVNINNFDF
jgi:hypothetical protein